MKSWGYKMSVHFKDRRFVRSFIFAVLFLIGSMIANYYAGTYATDIAGNTVTDIVLSNIRVYDVDSIFLFGPMILWVIFIVLCVSEPKRLPFMLKSVALFVVIRAFFVTLTHLGPFVPSVSDGSWFLEKYTFAGDLFFSGHTGLPFLMALLFWEYPRWRWFFIVNSVFFGIVVLLGHYHYSIDVLAAFFITYTIFHIATIIFPQDYAVFRGRLPERV